MKFFMVLILCIALCVIGIDCANPNHPPKTAKPTKPPKHKTSSRSAKKDNCVEFCMQHSERGRAKCEEICKQLYKKSQKKVKELRKKSHYKPPRKPQYLDKIIFPERPKPSP